MCRLAAERPPVHVYKSVCYVWYCVWDRPNTWRYSHTARERESISIWICIWLVVVGYRFSCMLFLFSPIWFFTQFTTLNDICDWFKCAAHTQQQQQMKQKQSANNTRWSSRNVSPRWCVPITCSKQFYFFGLKHREAVDSEFRDARFFFVCFFLFAFQKKKINEIKQTYKQIFGKVCWFGF